MISIVCVCWGGEGCPGPQAKACALLRCFNRVHLCCPWDFPGKNSSGLPCPPPGDLPNSGIEPTSPVSPALAGRFFLPLMPPRKPGKGLGTSKSQAASSSIPWMMGSSLLNCIPVLRKAEQKTFRDLVRTPSLSMAQRAWDLPKVTQTPPATPCFQ